MHALKDAREIGQAATLMFALVLSQVSPTFSAETTAAANAQLDELFALAEEKDAPFWKAFGMISEGCVLALTGKASDAVQMIASGITAYRSTGATTVCAVALIIFGESLCGPRPIR